MTFLGDYLDSLDPEEIAAWSQGPHAFVQRRQPLLGVVPVLPSPTPSTTLAPAPLVYYGGTLSPTVMPRVSPTSTPPVDTATWRNAVSLEALNLASAVAVVLRRYPASPVTTALFVTPLRSFGLLVRDPARMTVDAARSTINGLAALLSGPSFVSAGGAAELRAGLDRIVAMIPASTPPSSGGGGMTITPTFPSGGGGGLAPGSPGGPPPAPGGGGGNPPPSTTSGCPTNASPVEGGCACDPGFAPNASLTACEPISTGGGSVPTRTTAGGSGGLGWLLLLGGAALAFQALRK